MTVAPQLFTRHPTGPVLTANDWPVEVNAVFNPGATKGPAGETVLVCRVEDRRGLSHLWVARSLDGVTGWDIDPEPLLSPGAEGELDQWGYEDPRVVYVEELGAWAITCTAYGPAGPAVYMVTTTDFVKLHHYGLIMPPEDKNAALLPRRINGYWYLLHRPVTATTRRAEIWMSRSVDLEAWRTARRVMPLRDGAWWDSERVGTGPPPIATEHGWLLVYHGVKQMVGGPIYRVGLALLDRDNPERLLRRAPTWVLAPAEPYERQGDAPNVVFPCGLTHDPGSGELRLYYGAADTAVALARAHLGELLDYLLSFPAEPAATVATPSSADGSAANSAGRKPVQADQQGLDAEQLPGVEHEIG